ncbi:MAG: DUF2007 domain-containing protein [Acidobacteria bacterium]|nr:DUF2007 domain-containing protein [Acidobacteriota bacterium]
MDPAEEIFAARYSGMDEQQLMEIARGYDTLGDGAQRALRAEFARRGLEPPLIEDQAEPLTFRQLVTLASYRDISEALVARTLLEDAGIPVFLQDENLGRIHWGVSNAIGGIRLQIEAEHVEAATRLLHENVPADIVFDEDEEPYLQPKCPVCHSEDITFEGADRDLALLSTFMLHVPLPLGGKSWRCHACNARWEDTEEEEAAEEEE